MQRSFSDLKYWAVRRLEQFLRKMNAAMGRITCGTQAVPSNKNRE